MAIPKTSMTSFLVISLAILMSNYSVVASSGICLLQNIYSCFCYLPIILSHKLSHTVEVYIFSSKYWTSSSHLYVYVVELRLLLEIHDSIGNLLWIHFKILNIQIAELGFIKAASEFIKYTRSFLRATRG